MNNSRSRNCLCGICGSGGTGRRSPTVRPGFCPNAEEVQEECSCGASLSDSDYRIIILCFRKKSRLFTPGTEGFFRIYKNEKKYHFYSCFFILNIYMSQFQKYWLILVDDSFFRASKPFWHQLDFFTKATKNQILAVSLLSCQRGMFSIFSCLYPLNPFYSSMLNSCFTVMAITPNIKWQSKRPMSDIYF